MLVAIYISNVLNYTLKEKAGQRKVKRVWSKLREEGGTRERTEKENSRSPEIKTCCTKCPLKLFVCHGAAVFRV